MVSEHRCGGCCEAEDKEEVWLAAGGEREREQGGSVQVGSVTSVVYCG